MHLSAQSDSIFAFVKPSPMGFFWEAQAVATDSVSFKDIFALPVRWFCPGSIRMKFFKPKLIECLHGYDLQTFLSDLAAGVTVGIVALPLAIGFAIASGVTPA